ncbi:MAG TPA: DUF5666 domain-containing protein [Anaerolineales bacterium]
MKSIHRFLFPLLALAAIALSVAGVALAREMSERDLFNVSEREIEITGVVESFVDNTLVIDGQAIVVPVSAEVKGEIVVGQVVKVHALVGDNGTLTAREIEPAMPGMFGDDDLDDDSANINGDDDLDDDLNDDSANINGDDDDDDLFDDVDDDHGANINGDDDDDDDNSGSSSNSGHDDDNDNDNSGHDDDDDNDNSGHDDDDDNDNSGHDDDNDNSGHDDDDDDNDNSGRGDDDDDD